MKVALLADEENTYSNKYFLCAKGRCAIMSAGLMLMRMRHMVMAPIQYGVPRPTVVYRIVRLPCARSHSNVTSPGGHTTRPRGSHCCGSVPQGNRTILYTTLGLGTPICVGAITMWSIIVNVNSAALVGWLLNRSCSVCTSFSISLVCQ